MHYFFAKHASKSRLTYASGFTLIEIAVVMIIIGVLITGALKFASSFTAGAREKITRQNSDSIKVALQNFVARNGRLPCPAVRATAYDAATFGLEAPTPGTCTGTIGLGAGLPTPGVFGTLPWKSLGLPTENAVDGWANQFSYAVTRTATQTSFATVGVMRGVLTLHNETPVANGLPATGNQTNACSTTAGDNSCNLFAAVIVISHGPNGLGARTWGGGNAPAPTSNRELANTDADVAFVNADNSNGVATFFDDIVMALAPADVLAPLLAQGFIKFDSVALAAKYQQLTAGLAANATEFRTGSAGARSYPLPTVVAPFAYTLDATRFNGSCDANPPTTIGLPNSADMQLIRDPWGNPFQYQSATNVVTAAESCPTYAVFVSAGPDGSFVTVADNSVYYLSKGEFDVIIANSGW